jgi:hypothetical protein
MAQMSTGLSRDERRAAAAASGGPIVYTYREFAALAGISERTLDRLFSTGLGPETVRLSARRKGVTGDAARTWLKQRACPAPAAPEASEAA